MTLSKTTRLQTGTVLQHGPKKSWGGQGLNAWGLLLRGIVLRSYPTDDDNAPNENGTVVPSGVYCDVMLYSTLPGLETQVLHNVPVLQEGGLHDGKIWKPRGSNRVSRTDLENANIANFDGDHVLVGFMEQSTNRPIILGGIPHPSVDPGNADRATGHRLRVKAADGEPNMTKHHGAVHGVDTNGNHIVDTTYANDGTLDDAGKEPGPPTDGKGSQVRRLPENAEHRVEMHAADGVVKAFEQFLKDKKVISIDGGETQTVEGKDGAAKLKLGSGDVHPAIAETLQLLWEAFFAKMAAFDAHIHPSAMGPTGTPVPICAMPSWDPQIASNKVSFPKNV